MKKTVALLPMKANSERVEGKNFKLLAGKPLFRWILDSLLDCSHIDQIVINTDARLQLEQSGLRETKRVIIRDRRDELCGDHVSMNLILEDDLKAISADRYVMTHTTNPFLSFDTIQAAINTYDKEIESGRHDSLFGATRVQSRFYDVDGIPINHDPNNLIRTQDLPIWYEENSCIYVFSQNSFKKTSARIGANPYIFEIPKLEAIDIDEKDDWFLASAVANGMQDRRNYA